MAARGYRLASRAVLRTSVVRMERTAVAFGNVESTLSIADQNGGTFVPAPNRRFGRDADASAAFADDDMRYALRTKALAACDPLWRRCIALNI